MTLVPSQWHALIKVGLRMTAWPVADHACAGHSARDRAPIQAPGVDHVPPAPRLHGGHALAARASPGLCRSHFPSHITTQSCMHHKLKLLGAVLGATDEESMRCDVQEAALAYALPLTSR